MLAGNENSNAQRNWSLAFLIEFFKLFFRCFSSVDISLHRPDPPAWTFGIAEMRRQRESHTENRMDTQWISSAEIGQVNNS